MSATQTRGAIAASVIFASAAFLYARLVGFGPSFDSLPHSALGTVLAEEALKLRAPQGRVTVITRGLTTYQSPAAQTQLASFKRTLKRAGATISSIREIKSNPIRLASVPAGDFLDLINKQTPDDIIVSFLGPPILNDGQMAKVGPQRPKILALCSGWMPRQVDLRRVFENHLVDVAIISRAQPLPGLKASNERERFEQLFTTITPENISELPMMAKSIP